MITFVAGKAWKYMHNDVMCSPGLRTAKLSYLLPSSTVNAENYGEKDIYFAWGLRSDYELESGLIFKQMRRMLKQNKGCRIHIMVFILNIKDLF